MPEALPASDDVEELRCDLLIFDLDGTLIDSQQDLANAVNATLAYLHRTPLDNRQIATFIGDGAAMLVHRALEVTGGADETLLAAAMPFFLAYYHEHKMDFTLSIQACLPHFGTSAPPRRRCRWPC